MPGRIVHNQNGWFLDALSDLIYTLQDKVTVDGLRGRKNLELAISAHQTKDIGHQVFGTSNTTLSANGLPAIRDTGR